MADITTTNVTAMAVGAEGCRCPERARVNKRLFGLRTIAAARQKEMNDSATVVATTTFGIPEEWDIEKLTGFFPSYGLPA